MEPAKFKEQNTTIVKPSNMTEDECGDLPAYKTGDGQTISCWQLSWRERIKLFLTGKLWAGLLVEKFIPPMWLSTDNPFIKNPKGGERQKDR